MQAERIAVRPITLLYGPKVMQAEMNCCQADNTFIWTSRMQAERSPVAPINKTYLNSFDLLKPHFYVHVVKLGFTE